MRLITLFMLIGIFDCYAGGFSQDAVISLSIKNRTLPEFFDAIEKKTDYKIFYKTSIIDQDQLVTLDVNEKQVSELLSMVLPEKNLAYDLVDKVIVITPAATVQQQKKITGTIIDMSTGEPLIGVSVAVEGTTIGVISNSDGKFSIDVPKADAVLLFSFVGYLTERLPIANKDVIDVSLVPEITKLDAVVVVGYGTQSKKSLTGSVATVGFEKFKDRSFSNISQALSGQMPGVNITQSQGAPGSSPIIKIRGSSSLTAGTSPLYVVDGIPLENFNLNMINSQDIASVDVLKDAASAAIYGSRGANGVILITTKNGKPGKTAVSFTYEHGIQQVPRKIDMMNAKQYIQYYIDAHNNSWVASGAGRSASDPNSARASVEGGKYTIPDDFFDPAFLQKVGNGTDWQSVAFRVAPSNNYQLSLSGGSEKTQFLVSAAYLDQTGIIDNNYYKRLALRTNIKSKLSERLTIGTNLAFTGIQDRTDGTLGKVDVVSLALQNSPIFPIYNENGNLGYQDPNSWWYRFNTAKDMALWHPYSLTREIDKKNKSYNTIGTAYVDINIIKGLTFRSSLSGNLSNGRLNGYQSITQGYGYGSSASNSLGIATSSFSFNWLTENTLNYEKQIGNHSIKALLGYTVQKQRDEFSYVTANAYPNDLVHTVNGGTINGGSSNASEWSMLSYLGRVNYSYMNKYFLTGTLRKDGSSRFGANNKWGYFPSVSAGWLISDENFMKNVTPVSNLKLKVSYGLSGNNQIPNYGSVALLGSGIPNVSIYYGQSNGAGSNYVFGNNVAVGNTTSTLPNPDLGWEKTAQFNVGIELSLFKNRVNITGEFYNSITSDLLLNVPVPDITGFSTQLTNVGKLRNRGVEINLNTHNVDGKFTWTTDFNYSTNVNKILKLGVGDAPIIYPAEFTVTVRNKVGQPMNNFIGYIFDGVYKNQTELNDPKSPHVTGALPGDPRIRDVNGDGRIDASDRTVIGNAQPDFIAGITNTFTYKGIEFSFMLQGSFGAEIINQQTRFNAVWNGGKNAYAEVANYWKSETDPGDGTHFRPTLPNFNALQNEFSTYWVNDASFVRVKNIRLSYMLPAKWMARFSVQSTRVYVNVENAFLFTKYKNGYDPENSTYNSTAYSASSNLGAGAQSSSAGVMAGGYNGTTSSTVPQGAYVGADYGSYPVLRVVTFGIKLDF